jgi:hypothetical protein
MWKLDGLVASLFSRKTRAQRHCGDLPAVDQLKRRTRLRIVEDD